MSQRATLVSRGWGPADKTTIAYLPIGYNRWESLNLDNLRDNLDVNFIRNRSNHESIASQMAAARVGNEGQRMNLPPEHEAYPHPGLSAGTVPFFADGGEAEGINDYALWRLNGARALPVGGTTPEDQPAGIFTLEPSA